MSDDRVPPWTNDPENDQELQPSESVFGDAPDLDDPTVNQRGSKQTPSRAIHDDDSYVDSARGKPRRGVKKHWGMKITLIVVSVIVLMISGGVAYAWFDLNGRLDNQDVDPMLGTSRPSTFTPTTEPSVKYPGDPFAGSPVNILVMGTDSREGSNAGISGDHPGGMRSDTTFIAHVSADRTRVDVVSIPRDTLITIPQCTDENGKVIAAAGWSNQGFNAAFAWGYDYGGSVATGAACSIRAVEEMSNVHIDAYVVVDFMGFVDVVDAIGGLDVTLLCPIYSREAGGISLPEGVNHIDGREAVDLARARTGKGLGDGSDLQRINRQHLLFNAVVDKVYAMNYVTNFPKVYGLVAAIIGSLTTDIGSNLADIAGFGFSLKNLNTSNVTFVTIPIGGAPDGVHVVLKKNDAEPIWESLRTDQYLPGHEPVAPETTEAASESASPTPTEPMYGPPAPTTVAATEEPAPEPTPEPEPQAPLVQSPSDCGR